MSKQSIKSGGGAVINGNVEAVRDFIGRDQINVTHHNFFTRTIIRRVVYRPSLLYWALLLILIGLYVLLWLITSEAGIKTSFTKPVDRLFYQLSSRNLEIPTLQGTNRQTPFVSSTTPQPTLLSVFPTATVAPTLAAVPATDTPEPSSTPTQAPTNTPTPTATPDVECTAKGDLVLLDRNMWPPQSVELGVTVPNGTKVNPIAWDGDPASPWVIVVYGNKEGWYSANLKDASHFECNNVNVMPIRQPLPPIPPTPPLTDTPTPTLSPTVVPLPPTNTVTSPHVLPTDTPTPQWLWSLDAQGKISGTFIKIDVNPTSYSIQASRLLSTNMDFANWWNMVQSGRQDEARISISVLLFNSSKKLVRRWDGVRCLPSQASVVNDNIEELFINCEFLRQVY